MEFVYDTPYFMISVNNYGIIVMDVVTKTIVDKVCFNKLISTLPDKFNILRLVPINNDGVKVVLENLGSFSYLWKNITNRGDGHSIFVDGMVSTRFRNARNEIATSLIAVNYMGYCQLIYYANDEGIHEAYVRFYNFYNHYKSKQYMEVWLGQVGQCTLMNENFEKGQIIIICGAKTYMYTINKYPYLALSGNPANKETKLHLVAENGYSTQYLNITVANSDLKSSISFGYVFLIFLAIVIVFYAIMFFLTEKVLTAKDCQSKVRLKVEPKEDSGNLRKAVRDSSFLEDDPNRSRVTRLRTPSFVGSKNKSVILKSVKEESDLLEGSGDESTPRRKLRKKQNSKIQNESYTNSEDNTLYESKNTRKQNDE